MQNDELLKPAEIAKRYGMPENLQARLRMTGDFSRFIKIGRRVFVRRSDLEAWLDTNVRTNTIQISNRERASDIA